MGWSIFKAKPRAKKRAGATRLLVEQLEVRELPTATADLIAFRPVTEYINYAQYPVAEAHEVDPKVGPGIRLNGDDDNRNAVRDALESAATAAENDLVRVDVKSAGNSFSLAWSDELKVWTTSTKTEALVEGTPYLTGQRTLWVEYVGLNHSTSAALSLLVTDGIETAQDDVVFHSFQSDVIAIGGNQQNPALVGDPRLGVFTIGLALYQQGYDVHLYSYNSVASTGKGAAFDEVKSAVLKRNVDYVAILGYSWGGGATYQLAAGLNADAALKGQYRLQYTAYIDGIKRGGIGAETRLPVGTAYHDNLYQRKDRLIKGNAVNGAVNVNVTATTWGKTLVHTALDDNATVQNTIVTNLKAKLLG
jgi:hypothetical protein